MKSPNDRGPTGNGHTESERKDRKTKLDDFADTSGRALRQAEQHYSHEDLATYLKSYEKWHLTSTIEAHAGEAFYRAADVLKAARIANLYSAEGHWALCERLDVDPERRLYETLTKKSVDALRGHLAASPAPISGDVMEQIFGVLGRLAVDEDFESARRTARSMRTSLVFGLMSDILGRVAHLVEGIDVDRTRLGMSPTTSSRRHALHKRVQQYLHTKPDLIDECCAELAVRTDEELEKLGWY